MLLSRVATVFVAVHFCIVTLASDTCEVITVNTCKNSRVLHKYTRTPITIPAGPNPGDGSNTYRSQTKALQGKRQYISRLRTVETKRCKNLMKPFLCAAMLPACEESSPEPIRPCRDFCMRTKMECEQNLAKLGLDWPPELECSLFPTSLENPRCISGLKFEEIQMKASDPSVEVRVPCRYVFNPSDEPRWMIHDIPVAEYSDRMRTERVNRQTTALIVENFVDSVDRGNYTCVSGDSAAYQFTRQINLENIRKDETSPEVDGPDTEMAPPAEGDIRLVNSQYSTKHSGMIQYYKDGQWGYLCEPLVWDAPNADVVCSQLGYSGSFFIAKFGSVFGKGDGVRYPSAAECTGQESRLDDCPLDPWELRSGCGLHSDLGVVCDTGLRETDIRLVGNSKPSEGVLEVYYNGEWGTVCSEGWDVKDAEVTCRQLGYHSPKQISSFTKTFDYSEARTSSIMLSNIECTGDEDSLFDCPKSNWYASDFCSHYRDVILGCTKEDADIVLGDLNVYEAVNDDLNFSLQCSAENVLIYLETKEPPKWTLPSGDTISGDTQVDNIQVYRFGSRTSISFEGFTDERNGGQYTCSVPGFNKTVTLTEETIAVSVEYPCAENEFNCGERCVPRRFLCDQEADCVNGSDEDEELCLDLSTLPECPEGMVACQLGNQCILSSAVCDGILDCEHGTDESSCDPYAVNVTCSYDTIPCPGDNECIALSAFCDGTPNCQDGSDELGCDGAVPFASACDDGSIPCSPYGECVPISAVCNGIPECSNGLDEAYCPNVTSCQPITIPECTVGLDYTESVSNFEAGLSKSETANLFSTLSVLFEGPCGTFFRPFMCATFAPPCGQTVKPPCREMCQLAIRRCLKASAGALKAEDLIPPGGIDNEQSCDALPVKASETCYLVKEVSISRTAGSASEDGLESRSVDCQYNLLPDYQPQWTTPSGSQVQTGDEHNIRAIYVSDTVTRLEIADFRHSRDGGRYTCSGQEFSDSVDL